jgi:glycosyltransferase involved in cell wall biosynthesis
MRLGVYSDMRFRRSGDRISAGQPFIRFITSLPPRVDEVVVFGRLDAVEGSLAYPLPRRGVRFVPLPHYPRVTALGAVARSLPRTCSAFQAELGRLDAVLVFGPHPVALVFACLARRRGTPLVLGVRHDYPRYIRGRLPGRGWGWAVPAARAIELAFLRLAARSPVIALGDELARRYQRGAPVLSTGFALVRRADVVSPEIALARDWHGELRVLSVGRLDPEKNPLLLVDILARLREDSRRWRLVVAGEGHLRPAVAAAAARRGLSDSLELLGHVPNGPQLWDLYRNSHAFLHVSLTEGLPQVLVEAMAAGLPIVATRVGGVAAALGDGARGLLVPPRDAGAAAAALDRLAADPQLRAWLAISGTLRAEEETLEVQLDRLAAFLASAVYGEPARLTPTSSRSARPPAAPARASSSHR